MQQGTPPKSQGLGYATPESHPNRFTKRVVRAFTIAASTAVIINIGIAITLGTLSDSAQAAFAVVNFPALPCVFGMLILGGPAPGDADMTPFERSIPILLAILGSVLWGLIAAMIAKATAGRPAA